MRSSDEFSDFPWYALKVKARSESLAANALKSRGYDPFCPQYQDYRGYSDRIKSVETPLFPGYLFCRFDITRKLPVISSPAVQYILTVDGEPANVEDEVIDSVRRAVSAGARPVPYLKSGQRVCVKFGPFAGIEGVLASEIGTGQLVVSVDLLQRSVALQVDEALVFPV